MQLVLLTLLTAMSIVSDKLEPQYVIRDTLTPEERK